MIDADGPGVHVPCVGGRRRKGLPHDDLRSLNAADAVGVGHLAPQREGARTAQVEAEARVLLGAAAPSLACRVVPTVLIGKVRRRAAHLGCRDDVAACNEVVVGRRQRRVRPSRALQLGAVERVAHEHREHLGGLGTRGVGLRLEARRCLGLVAGDDAPAVGPPHGVPSVGVYLIGVRERRDIAEIAAHAAALGKAMQHRGEVLPGNRVIGPEQARADVARGDAVLIGPLHGGGEILACGDIIEVRGLAVAGGVGRGVAGGVGVAVQDDKHLSAADLVLGAKVAGVGARGVSRHEAGRRHVVEPALRHVPLVGGSVLVQIGFGGSKGVGLGGSGDDLELAKAQDEELLGHCLLDLDRRAVEDPGDLVLLEEPQAGVGGQVHLDGGTLSGSFLRNRRVGGCGSVGCTLGTSIGRLRRLLGNLDGIGGSVGQEVHHAARPVGEGHLELHELGLAHAQGFRSEVEHEEPTVGARRLEGDIAQRAPHGQHTLCRLRILVLQGNSERHLVAQSGGGVARVGKVHKLSGGNRGNSVSLGVTGRLVYGVILLGRLVSRAAVPLGGLVRTGSGPVARGRRLVGADTCGIVRRSRDVGLGRRIGVASGRRIGLARRGGRRLVGIARGGRVGPGRLLRVGRGGAVARCGGLLGITRGIRSPGRHVVAVAFLLATVVRSGPLLLVARSARLRRVVSPGRAHARHHTDQGKHARQHQHKQCVGCTSRAFDLSHMGLRFPSEFAFATPSMCVYHLSAWKGTASTARHPSPMDGVTCAAGPATLAVMGEPEHARPQHGHMLLGYAGQTCPLRL